MTEKHPYELKLIPAKDINVDRRYQRQEKPPMVKRIVNDFDYHLVNAVKVIMDDAGRYYAWDGQQTTVGLRMKFGDDYLVPCFIYYDIPQWVDAAVLFERANDPKGKKAVSEAERWTSMINRGEETHLFMIKVCAANGLRVNYSGGKTVAKGKILALHAMDGIYQKYGADNFVETINVISSAWDGEPKSLEAPVLRGVAIFCDTYKGVYDKKRLVKKLSEVSPIEIIRGGRASAENSNKKYARQILEIYNRNLQNRLDTSKL